MHGGGGGGAGRLLAKNLPWWRGGMDIFCNNVICHNLVRNFVTSPRLISKSPLLPSIIFDFFFNKK